MTDSNIKLPKVFTCKADSESLKLRIARESLMHWLLNILLAQSAPLELKWAVVAKTGAHRDITCPVASETGYHVGPV